MRAFGFVRFPLMVLALMLGWAALHARQDHSPRNTVRFEIPATDGGLPGQGPATATSGFAGFGPSGRPGEWNETEVVFTGGVACCPCNGEVLEPALSVSAAGPIGFEGDRGQMEYRRIRIREGKR